MSSTQFSTQWNSYKQQVELALNQLLPAGDSLLEQAMRYSCLQGGKRFRAMLVYAGGSVFNAPLNTLDSAAAALEMIHAYSLVHDDLPAMDDDALRRGRASCHIQYDEATAILAGDALQSLAFEVLASRSISSPTSGPTTSPTSSPTSSPARQLAMVKLLASASGFAGMAGGQSLDMRTTGARLPMEQLQTVHENKTGALIRAAVGLGALAATNSTAQARQWLDDYGHAIGLAFQVTDDILDQTQTSEQLGKQSGADALMDKNTYPSLIGLEKAQLFAQQLHQQALQSLDKLSDKDHNTGFLRQLANFTISREY